MTSIKENLDAINQKIQSVQYKIKSNKPVTIIAVTKTMPSEIVQEALACGLSRIGENRVQEAEKKFMELIGLTFERHLIGHLQENKANKAAELFNWVQSIDKFDTAQKLNRKLQEMGKKISILIEVNTSGEESKSGIRPDETEDFTGQINSLQNLEIRGLMTIGPLNGTADDVRKAFRHLYSLREKLVPIYRNLNLDTLSMGMSGDFETAIEEGSTMVRLGSALFGERMYR